MLASTMVARLPTASTLALGACVLGCGLDPPDYQVPPDQAETTTPPTTCVALANFSASAELANPEGRLLSQPTLTYAGDDTSVTLLMTERIPDDPTRPAALRSTRFYPWHLFPSRVGPAQLTHPALGASFAATRSSAGYYALALSNGAGSELPEGVHLAPAVRADGSLYARTEPLDPYGRDVLFIERSGPWHATGYVRSTAGREVSYIMVALEGEEGLALTGPGPLGCSHAGPISAAATSVSDGWLVAHATLDPSLCLSGPIPGAPDPNLLVVAHVGFDGAVGIRDMVPLAQPIARVRMARDALGAVVAFADVNGVLNVGRIDLTGDFVMGPVPTFGTPNFDVSLLGDRAVVAYNAGGDTNVALIAADGTIASNIGVRADGTVLGPLAVLPSPDARSLLMAWIAVGDGVRDLRLARVDCVDSPVPATPAPPSAGED
jgi:hypothetical protein